MLKLPSYQQLSKEQDAINNLPLNSSYMVIGPPGTGKTVMAIYRAAMFKKTGKKSHFMVYSRPLTQYLEQAMKETGVDGIATTLHSWFPRWYWQNFRQTLPQLADWVYDWNAIFEALSRHSSFDRYDHIVVDEGQDFPKEFYLVIRLLTDNITVFADENQRITEQNSTLKEIALYAKARDTYKLTRNYRNTRPIAEFAAHFYNGLSTGIPELPVKAGPKPRVVRASSLEAQVEFIARYERTNSDKDIAVFVATTQQQRTIHRLLLGKTHNPVQMYVSKDKQLKVLNFQEQGIKVINYQSAKGLEFDTVFLPCLDTRLSAPQSELEKMRFYVLASRAREELYLLYCGSDCPPLIQTVPPALYQSQSI